jgi:hypothetical protein
VLHLLASLALVAATLIAARRYGVRRVALPACVPLLMSMAGPLQWVLVSGLAPAPLIGLLAAIQIERGRGYGEIIAMASVPGLALALMLMFSLDGSSDQRREIGDQVSVSLQGMGAETPEPEQLQQVIELMLQLFPGMAYLSMLFVAVVGYRMACGVAGRLQMSLPQPTPLHRWRFWDELIWGLIGALVLLLVFDGNLRTIGANALLVMAALYAVQGLALVRHALWRLGIQRFLEIVIYALLLFTSGISLVVLGLLGLMDTWFDWRRLGHARVDEVAGDDEEQ